MIKDKEYVMSINHFNKSEEYTEKRAIAILLTRLILLIPGSDPLHPDMGVGIQNYRYGIKTLDDLKLRIKDQIETYLPCYNSAEVNLVLTPSHLLNIEITVDDTIFVYDSTEADVPITLDNLASQ